MESRCVGIVLPLSRNFHQLSTIWLRCISTATACHVTTLALQTYWPKLRPKVWRKLEKLGDGV